MRTVLHAPSLRPNDYSSQAKVQWRGSATDPKKLMERDGERSFSSSRQTDWQGRKIPQELSDTKAPSLTPEVLGQQMAGGREDVYMPTRY